jgi:hypothetical protein
MRGRGVENFLHTNLLSENISPTKGICTRFPRPKEVGGYIRGVSSELGIPKIISTKVFRGGYRVIIGL